MLLNKRLLLVSLLLMIVFMSMHACTPEYQKNTDAYIAEIEHWHQLRIDSLKGKTGFLNLAGLYWLGAGVNTIGSDTSNKFVFPATAPAKLGHFYVHADSVWFNPEQNEDIKVAGKVVEDSVLVYTKSGLFRAIRFHAFNWYIIKRGKELGIRLKDFEHPLLTSFKGIENYPIDAKWKVKATWEQYPEPKLVHTKNQVGMDLELPAPGAFHFKLNDQDFTLEPTGSVEDETYFTMIYDETSGHSTYGSGRYIDVPRPDENGVTYIDFNKAYNPPCAWTAFATCTFPHAANRLPIKIEAGEKYSGMH